MELNAYIDHTLLKPTATEKEIINLCNEAITYNFRTVCVNSCYIPIAKQVLKETPVGICTVVSFPLGAMSTKAKIFEAQEAIEQGATEIDMVMNIGFLKSRNYVAVLKDINDIKIAIGSTPLKVILEISELSKNEIVKACEICIDAKVDYVKTSTGFSSSGATLTAVKIMKKTVKGHAKIKASGGIRNYATAMKYIEAGVERIGTSSGVDMMNNQNLKVAN
ncbi:deoxyribose-phosphate aldolase [Winogradskyella sp. PC-19]|uniref:deoxyribose-phosphate aldolase n=1 Tax=unclassified Winogradskyella TaxID=2615021 RepID=UPI000B3C431C|nr:MULTISPECIES: deoxyribose-phosphate aldolase [unclassified Winogradskyella]ARV08162.1 deoxyribose-phosphate aldolase [Winogradskyella sp. PC-19]RZN78721.1 MAG: deoxyribose-phosphate aldolase [Winogradskyella sp.]